ncbi:MAG: hypothetical protein AB1650_04945 [Candidatus Omnitrophota bacterium]
MNNYKRQLFPSFKKYQNHLMMLVFIPAVIMHMFLYGLLSFMHLSLFDALFGKPYASVVASLIDRWSVLLLFVSGMFIILYLIVAFFVSRNLLGAFNRIINELDEVVEGKKKGPLFARKYDFLANEILKRVNSIIARIPQ